MKPATEWQRLLSSEQYRVGDFVPWIEDIQRDAIEAAAQVYCKELGKPNSRYSVDVEVAIRSLKPKQQKETQ